MVAKRAPMLPILQVRFPSRGPTHDPGRCCPVRMLVKRARDTLRSDWFVIARRRLAIGDLGAAREDVDGRPSPTKTTERRKSHLRFEPDSRGSWALPVTSGRIGSANDDRRAREARRTLGGCGTPPPAPPSRGGGKGGVVVDFQTAPSNAEALPALIRATTRTARSLWRAPHRQ